MILDKKPGLIVHPDEHYHFDSLIARVQHYLYENGEYDPEAENSFAILKNVAYPFSLQKGISL